MVSEALAPEHAFLRGESRLTVPEYVGLVASCQAAFDAAMSELPPSRQVDLWNAFNPETFLPSSGKRMLWVLRRGVLDDLAPSVESVLGRGQPEPAENEQLVFRAVLEALATGRERPGEIIEFCNEIYPWPSVLGVAEYLTGNLAEAVRVATMDVASERQPRRVHLPSWALVGTLLEALGTAPGKSRGIFLVPFTAALATVLGPERERLTSEHARLLVQLYVQTGAGRRDSAKEASLRASLGIAEQSTAWRDGFQDKFQELVQALQSLQLLQVGPDEAISWTTLTLVHLPPGEAAKELKSSILK